MFLFRTAEATVVAAAVVAVVATIVSNILISSLNPPKAVDNLGDKIDARLQASFDKSENRDFQKILFSPDVNERLKFLKRHMKFKRFVFTSTVPANQLFQEIVQKIEASAQMRNEFGMQMHHKVFPHESVIQLNIPRAKILLGLRQAEDRSYAVMNVANYEDEKLSFKEFGELENRTSAVLDNLRLMITGIIEKYDRGYTVEIK